MRCYYLTLHFVHTYYSMSMLKYWIELQYLGVVKCIEMI